MNPGEKTVFQMVDEINLELTFRRNVYPKQIENKKITKTTANHRYKSMDQAKKLVVKLLFLIMEDKFTLNDFITPCPLTDILEKHDLVQVSFEAGVKKLTPRWEEINALKIRAGLN